MAALGKRPTLEQRSTALDSWGQPFITDAELAEAEGIVNRANVTPLWALCMQDSGLVAPGHEDNAYDIVRANHIMQHAKRQREELKKEEEETKIKEAAQKKQKTEENSDEDDEKE